MTIKKNVIIELNHTDLIGNTLTIPKNAEDIDIFYEEGNWLALNECKNIVVEDGNTAFYVKDGCLINSNTKTLICGLDNAKIPADGSVETIGHYAFNMRKMDEITIPETIKEIDYMAFASTDAKKVYIPKSVQKIYPCAFLLNKNINIAVDSGNLSYNVQGGCLLENGEKIIATFGKNIVIPEGVRSVEKFTFMFANHKSITIPASVTQIDEDAFIMCEAKIKAPENSYATKFFKSNNLNIEVI